MAQIVLSGLMLAMTTVATALVVAIRGASKRTEDAVHTSDGTSASEQLTRLEGRIASNEARMTDHSVRLNRLDRSTAAAHRRLDDVVLDHGARLTTVEHKLNDLHHLEAP